MRLYLSSFRLGDHPAALTRLAPTPGPALIIANACDDADPATRSAAVEREHSTLRDLGYTTEELDLRDHLHHRAALARRFTLAQLLWVRGGNVFVLRTALRRSGADVLITELLRTDEVAYGGYSAGACVLAPSLRGLERCDDPAASTRVWGEPAIDDGLGVLDRAVVPHLDSPGHPESAVLDQVAADYARTGVAHHRLRDGDVLVVDGDQTTLLGRS